MKPVELAASVSAHIIAVASLFSVLLPWTFRLIIYRSYYARFEACCLCGDVENSRLARILGISTMRKRFRFFILTFGHSALESPKRLKSVNFAYSFRIVNRKHFSRQNEIDSKRNAEK